MANYNDSLLLDAVGLIRESKEAPEFRMGNYGALDASMKMREYSIPELSAIKQSVNRATVSKYLTDTNVTIGTVASDRGVTLTGEAGDSATITLSWVPRFFTIKSDHKLFLNNQYTKEQALARLLQSAFKKMYVSLDTYVVAALEAAKTQVQGDRTLGTWDNSGYRQVIANADKNNLYNYIQTELSARDFNGPLMDIHTVNANALFAQQQAQGQANSTNLQFQFGNIEGFTSNVITNATDCYSTHYVVPEGGIALLDWANPLFAEGRTNGAQEFYSMQDPNGYPFVYEVYKTKGVADTHAAGGDYQSWVDQWQVGFWVAFAKAPLSASNDSVIHKYTLAKS